MQPEGVQLLIWASVPLILMIVGLAKSSWRRAVIALLMVFHAFVIYKLYVAAQTGGPPILIGAAIISMISELVLVPKDAKSRGMSGALWGFLAFIGGPLVAAIYLAVSLNKKEDTAQTKLSE